MMTDIKADVNESIYETAKNIIESLQHRHQLFVFDNIWGISENGEIVLDEDKIRTVDVVRFIKNHPDFSNAKKRNLIATWDTLKEHTLQTSHIVLLTEIAGKENEFESSAFQANWKLHDPLKNALDITYGLSEEKPYVMEAIRMKEVFSEEEVELIEFESMIEEAYNDVYKHIIEPQINEIVQGLSKTFYAILETAEVYIQQQIQKRGV